MSSLPRKPRTAFPFGFSRRDFDRELRSIPDADLMAEIESQRRLIVDLGDVPGDSRRVGIIQFESLIAEAERRKALHAKAVHDPFRPEAPRLDHDQSRRIARMLHRWPIQRFCEELLACGLRPAGKGRFKCRCPLPCHADRTPSFVVFVDDDRAWCFGCNRGGNCIKLTQYYFGLDRITDALQKLEAS